MQSKGARTNSEMNEQDKALRLLKAVYDKTRGQKNPVLVTRLDIGLTKEESEAAWRYLKEKRWIQTFSVDYTARVSAGGIDLIESSIRPEKGVGTNPDMAGQFNVNPVEGGKKSEPLPAPQMAEGDSTIPNQYKKSLMGELHAKHPGTVDPSATEHAGDCADLDFDSELGRTSAVTAYTQRWNCTEASLARTARVAPADLSKWKKSRLLPAKSEKRVRIEKVLRDNTPPIGLPNSRIDS